MILRKEILLLIKSVNLVSVLLQKGKQCSFFYILSSILFASLGNTTSVTKNFTPKAADNDVFVIAFVILKPEYELVHRRDYENRIAPAVMENGGVLEQSYVISEPLSLTMNNVKMLNVYRMQSDNVFFNLLSDPEYLKHAEFRDSIHDMQQHTIYFTKSIESQSLLTQSNILIELLVPSNDYDKDLLASYHQEKTAIAEQCGLKTINSYMITGKFMGIGSKQASRVNLWQLSKDNAVQCFESSAALKALNNKHKGIYSTNNRYMAAMDRFFQ